MGFIEGLIMGILGDFDQRRKEKKIIADQQASRQRVADGQDGEADLVNTANLLFKEANGPELFIVAKRMNEKYPQNWYSKYYLAMACLMTKKADESLVLFQELVSDNTSANYADMALVHYYIAIILRHAGEFSDAETHRNRALDLDNNINGYFGISDLPWKSH